MHLQLFSELGLTKNESKIYATLLEKGESSVGAISTNAAINRRNVYDSIDRLIEKGLIFEIRHQKENLYQAVDPRKLMEKVKEKEVALENAMPDLLKMFGQTTRAEEVFIYRGIEGWKNYLRDILRVGKDSYTLGGKGVWTDPKIKSFVEHFIKEADKKKIGLHILFDHEVKETNHETLKFYESNHKFLPKGFSTPAAIDVFGDHVVILSNLELGKIDESSSFTVIVNQQIADAVRTWFRLIWELSSSKKR
jgi:sugar-specific transcriptional regulator TrmB